MSSLFTCTLLAVTNVALEILVLSVRPPSYRPPGTMRRNDDDTGDTSYSETRAVAERTGLWQIAQRCRHTLTLDALTMDVPPSIRANSPSLEFHIKAKPPSM
jgi:hypothetical protein